MEILEGNKLIAEFMKHPYLKIWKKYNDVEPFDFNRLKYHSSWNWLMGAWKKFYDTVIMTEWYKDESTTESNFELDCMEYSLSSANLNGAFKHFINLLQWYNNQSKK